MRDPFEEGLDGLGRPQRPESRDSIKSRDSVKSRDSIRSRDSRESSKSKESKSSVSRDDK